MLATLVAILVLSGSTASSSAEDATGHAFGPAKASTSRLLVFNIATINPREVRSARLYTAGGSTPVRAAVVRDAIAAGVLKIRRSARQARADRSPAARRRGRPKLVITTKAGASGPVTAISGTTYYVSADGSDSNSGRSRGDAWRSVRRVNRSSLDPGDGVLFEGGQTFAGGALTPTRSGSASRPIVYGSYGSGQAKLPEGVYLLNVGGLAFQRLTISGARQAVLASASGTVADITIEGMTISDGQIAINSASDRNRGWTIRDNTISRIGDSGMILEGATFSITANTILQTGMDRSIDFAKHGIYLKATGATVSRNVIHGFETSGVSVRFRDSVIEHNTIADGRYGLAWHQYDPVAGRSFWRDNTISDTTVAGIYVSPRDRAGRTRESFVITGNTLSKRAGVYTDLEPTTGSYTVNTNTER